MDFATEYDPACDDDKDEQDYFNDTEDVHKLDADIWHKGMNAGDCDDDRNRNSTLCPLGNGPISCNQDILSKEDTSGSCGRSQSSTFTIGQQSKTWRLVCRKYTKSIFR